MEIKRIIDIQRHRNGVAGAPFHVILFNDRDSESSRKVAVVFDDDYFVAVLDIDKLQTGNITFGQNSWRGDIYEPELRKAIADRDSPSLKTGDNVMTTPYRVRLEIEEIDESRDHFQKIDTPGGSVAKFVNYQEACEFVEHANALLNSDAEPLVPVNPAEIRKLASCEGFFKLLLLHGRKDAEQDMEDWGFSAEPILGVKWMHFTYFSTITIGFESVEATEVARKLTGWSLWDTCVLEISKHDDMIRAADCFYGDFELIADTA